MLDYTKPVPQSTEVVARRMGLNVNRQNLAGIESARLLQVRALAMYE